MNLPRLSIIISLFAIMLCAGCASLAERGMLPDIKARHVPDVSLSPEIILLDKAKIVNNVHIKTLISSDGRTHLFIVDREKEVHHVEVSGNEVLLHEILGSKEAAAPNMPLDAVEHPAGRLVVLAGDSQFIRSLPDNKWQEIKGNICRRFITVGDDLFCAFIANGKELGAPERRDWTVGWFILIPVAYWSDVIADKLVLAQQSNNTWIIRAVFDPETELSARSDFMVGTARDGSLHFLYRASGEGRAFLVAFGPGGGGAWGGDMSGMEIRYARVQYDQLLSWITENGKQEARKDNPPIPWSAIHGLPLAGMPYVGVYERPTSLGLLGSLYRHFAVNDTPGDLSGLVWVYNLELDDGLHKLGVSENHTWIHLNENPWIHLKLREGKWAPHFDIITMRDLPESGWEWINDLGALIQNDSRGNNHVLLVKSKIGFWSSTHEMCYFFNSGDDWSAPLIIGNNLGIDSRRSIAVDGTGKVFAAWQNKSDNVVGRWILPGK